MRRTSITLAVLLISASSCKETPRELAHPKNQVYKLSDGSEVFGELIQTNNLDIIVTRDANVVARDNEFLYWIDSRGEKHYESTSNYFQYTYPAWDIYGFRKFTDREDLEMPSWVKSIQALTNNKN